MDINRNLAYTMKAHPSLTYLKKTFRKTLNYLCKTNKQSSIQNNLIVDEINRSCITLFTIFLSDVKINSNTTQEHIRQAYYHVFKNESTHRSQPKLQINNKKEPNR